jgi:hypothetical protein
MLQNPKIKESSGICRSVLHKDVYWTAYEIQKGNQLLEFLINKIIHKAKSHNFKNDFLF